jgi:hypothetical protein
LPVAIDVAERRVVIDGEKEKPEADDWYLDDAGYFFAGNPQPNSPPRPMQGKVTASRLDRAHHAARRVEMTVKQLAGAREIKYNRDPRQMLDCTSVPQ